MNATNGKTERGRPALLSPIVQNALCTLSLIAMIVLGVIAYRSGGAQEKNKLDRQTLASPTFQIDINRADRRELTMMPGIGELTADRILSDRQQNGPFANLDDLQRVSGVGPKTVRDIRPYCMVVPE